MNIAMILPSLSNTGPGIVVKELCCGLVANGHTCKVFYFDNIVELDMPCPVERLRFRDCLNFADWDVIHSHMLRPDLYVRLHKIHIQQKPLLVTTLHNPISYTALRMGYNWFWSLLGSLAWKFALTVFQHIVVLNPYTASTINGVNKKKITVIFNGKDVKPSLESCESKDIQVISKLRRNYVIVGTISGIHYRKGLEQVIRALSLLPNFAFVAVGDGPDLNKLKQLAKDIGVFERCYFTGYKKNNASNYLSLIDIFVMCSRSEGFPLALIEAAGYAKPTVLSDIPILKSIVTSNEVAFYFLNNIDSLAAQLTHVNENRRTYSQAIYRWYRQNLTAATMIEKYIDLYNGNK